MPQARGLRFGAEMKAAELFVVGFGGVTLLLGLASGCRGATADANSAASTSFDDDASVPPVVSTVTIPEPALVPDAAAPSLDATFGDTSEASVESDDGASDGPGAPPFDAGDGERALVHSRSAIFGSTSS